MALLQLALFRLYFSLACCMPGQSLVVITRDGAVAVRHSLRQGCRHSESVGSQLRWSEVDDAAVARENQPHLGNRLGATHFFGEAQLDLGGCKRDGLVGARGGGVDGIVPCGVCNAGPEHKCTEDGNEESEKATHGFRKR